MNRNTNRALLMAAVGGYVLYLAYELLRNLLEGKTGAMSVPVMILAIVFFVGAGGAVLIYAWRIHREPADQDPVLVEETDPVRERSGEAAAESSSGQDGRRELPLTEEKKKGKADEGKDAAGVPPDSAGAAGNLKTE